VDTEPPGAEPSEARADARSAADVEAERKLVAALRAGDEQAFAAVLDRYYDVMLRVARTFVASREAAEDVVQETFLGVVQGIDRFEERSSLRTWMFRILVNRARSRGERENRSRPFSSLANELDGDDPAVDPDRFLSGGRWAGYWSAPPSAADLPEPSVLAHEAHAHLLDAIERLPPNQRAVITLRDVQGLTAVEVCELLELSEANQRVLLHRARSKARAAVEDYVRRVEA